jgi:hypothetical protein
MKKAICFLGLALLVVSVVFLSGCAGGGGGGGLFNQSGNGSGGNITPAGGLEIVSMSASSAPMEPLTVFCYGFDANASLFVRFYDGAGFKADVPVLDTASNSVTVAVPPFIDLDNGNITSGKVSVVLVQKSNAGEKTSNAFNFTIQDLPYPAIPTGALTLVYVKSNADFARNLSSRFTGTDAETLKLKAALDDQAELLDLFAYEIMLVANGTIDNFSLGSFNGVPLTIGMKELQNSDRMILGMLHAQAGGSEALSSAPAAGGSVLRMDVTVGCQAHEAKTLAQVVEEGGESYNTMSSLMGIYGNAPLTSINCKTAEAFGTTLKVVGASGGAALSLFSLAGIGLEATALSTAALSYVTTTAGMVLTYAGGVLGQTTDGARDMVREGYKEISSGLERAWGAIKPSVDSDPAGDLKALWSSASDLKEAITGKGLPQLPTNILTVEAGPAQTMTLPNSAQLHATATIAFPTEGLVADFSWSLISGPAYVQMSAPESDYTSVTFSEPGTYVLRATAVYGETTASDDVTITVNPEEEKGIMEGSWSGTYSDVASGGGGCTYDSCGTLTMTVTQSGSSFSGTASIDGVELRYTSDCSYAGTSPAQGTVSGTVSGSTVTGSFNLVTSATGTGMSRSFTGTVIGNSISTNWQGTGGATGSFTVTKS